MRHKEKNKICRRPSKLGVRENWLVKIAAALAVVDILGAIVAEVERRALQNQQEVWATLKQSAGEPVGPGLGMVL